MTTHTTASVVPELAKLCTTPGGTATVSPGPATIFFSP